MCHDVTHHGRRGEQDPALCRGAVQGRQGIVSGVHVEISTQDDCIPRFMTFPAEIRDVDEMVRRSPLPQRTGGEEVTANMAQ